ncbi:MAG: hypothetical protein B7C24_00720 [Bacteroidetes bacterium 4572_77]|nr:MAG: hypothetical protein B7C24_00720 [Bacteroidetes bacterium 4572_77]
MILKPIFIKILFVLALMPAVTSLFAQEPLKDQKEWLAKINAKNEHITSLQADFEQQKVMSFLLEPISSYGKFWFQKENSIRWEYQKPYSYIIIMDNGQLRVKDGKDEYNTDLSANAVFQQMNSLISGSIQGDLLQDQQHYSFLFFENENQIIIRVLPKDEQLLAYLDYMELYFHKEQLHMEILLMHEPSGDFTKMIFSNSILNKEIDEDVFK